jgi:integrase
MSATCAAAIRAVSGHGRSPTRHAMRAPSDRHEGTTGFRSLALRRRAALRCREARPADGALVWRGITRRQHGRGARARLHRDEGRVADRQDARTAYSAAVAPKYRHDAHRPFGLSGDGVRKAALGQSLWQLVKKRCREAGLEEVSAHGLRKLGAQRCAEAGATEHQLMALFGWTTPQQAALYKKNANRAEKALMINGAF